MNNKLIIGVIALVATVLVLAVVRADLDDNGFKWMKNMHQEITKNIKDKDLVDDMDKMHENCEKMMESLDEDDFEAMEEMHESMHGSGKMGMMH